MPADAFANRIALKDDAIFEFNWLLGGHELTASMGIYSGKDFLVG